MFCAPRFAAVHRFVLPVLVELVSIVPSVPAIVVRRRWSTKQMKRHPKKRGDPVAIAFVCGQVDSLFRHVGIKISHVTLVEK